MLAFIFPINVRERRNTQKKGNGGKCSLRRTKGNKENIKISCPRNYKTEILVCVKL